ncbi:MAG: caspase family protein [Deltaproteobacteria bacterium]|nr:caspase family protein [Deltaproteobacteria bacterium]
MTYRLSLRFATLLLLATTARARAEGDRLFDPPKTWVFAIGVMEWKQADRLASFYSFGLKGGRRDAELVNQFRIRGVPESQIVFITDRKATYDSLLTRFRDFIARAKPNDSLFFYFNGHGIRVCYSGGFANVVEQVGKKKKYVVLASSQANLTSTGAWTFTTTLLKAIRGYPTLDLDNNGTIELQEVSEFAEREMGIVERQMSRRGANIRRARIITDRMVR